MLFGCSPESPGSTTAPNPPLQTSPDTCADSHCHGRVPPRLDCHRARRDDHDGFVWRICGYPHRRCVRPHSRQPCELRRAGLCADDRRAAVRLGAEGRDSGLRLGREGFHRHTQRVRYAYMAGPTMGRWSGRISRNIRGLRRQRFSSKRSPSRDSGLGDRFMLTEEFYTFRDNPQGVQVLLRLDPSSVGAAGTIRWRGHTVRRGPRVRQCAWSFRRDLARPAVPASDRRSDPVGGSALIWMPFP